MPRKLARLSFSYENPLQMRFEEEFFQEIPAAPGIYLMLNSKDEILYIGKAKVLRKRVASYRRARPGFVLEHILEMLPEVTRIKWEVCKSEAEASRRELELIQAFRPPFNIAANWESSYFFIGIRYDETGRVHFRLTSRERSEVGERLYGCYKNRRLTKSGYTSLLRLIHAAQSRRPRFSFPAKISRASPPYSYASAFKNEWRESLRSFLSGRSRAFLSELIESMLENENIPSFIYPGLQEDILTVNEFYRFGPKATRKLKVAQGITNRLVGHRMMDKLIAATVAL